MLITLGVVGIHAVGVDGHVHFVCRGILFIKGKGSVEVFKRAVQPAIAQVLNAEINKGMLSFFVNFIICRNGRTGGEQQRGES